MSTVPIYTTHSKYTFLHSRSGHSLLASGYLITLHMYSWISVTILWWMPVHLCLLYITITGNTNVVGMSLYVFIQTYLKSEFKKCAYTNCYRQLCRKKNWLMYGTGNLFISHIFNKNSDFLTGNPSPTSAHRGGMIITIMLSKAT